MAGKNNPKPIDECFEWLVINFDNKYNVLVSRTVDGSKHHVSITQRAFSGMKASFWNSSPDLEEAFNLVLNEMGLKLVQLIQNNTGEQ